MHKINSMKILGDLHDIFKLFVFKWLFICLKIAKIKSLKWEICLKFSFFSTFAYPQSMFYIITSVSGKFIYLAKIPCSSTFIRAFDVYLQ